jgi:hypothetical protein
MSFDQLFEKARLHVEAGGSAGRPFPFETILISMLLEQEKEMVDLREDRGSKKAGRMIPFLFSNLSEQGF